MRYERAPDAMIRLLIWDDWNLRHLAERHGVTPVETVEVIAGEPVFLRSYQNRLLVLGPKGDGRIMVVVLDPESTEEGVYYPVSARPASRRERRWYSQQQGDAPEP